MEPTLCSSPQSTPGDGRIDLLGSWPEAYAGAWNESLREFDYPPRILVIDDLEIHLLLIGSILRQEGCQVVTARSGREGLARLRAGDFDLVVLDVAMPDMDGFEVCRRIRADAQTKLLPVLMLVGLRGFEQKCLDSGADEIMERPCTPEEFRVRVRSMLRQKSAIDRLEESEAILFSLAEAVEQRDPYTAGHCERLALYSVALGMRLSLPPLDLLALYRGGFLHDIGKVGMPDSILFKPGPLNEDEWKLMRTHTLRGEQICAPLRCLRIVKPLIRSHHERWDGSGYPDGLRGEKIPLLARILQYADVFDALTTDRPYKDALTIRESLRVIQHETDEGWHDPALLPHFLELRHDELREMAECSGEQWRDLDGMKRSLENLRSALA